MSILDAVELFGIGCLLTWSGRVALAMLYPLVPALRSATRPLRDLTTPIAHLRDLARQNHGSARAASRLPEVAVTSRVSVVSWAAALARASAFASDPGEPQVRTARPFGVSARPQEQHPRAARTSSVAVPAHPIRDGARSFAPPVCGNTW